MQIIKSNFNTKTLLKNPKDNIKFFKSIIGPNIKNAITPGAPKLSINPLATNASASEHNDNKKPNSIIIAIPTTFPDVILLIKLS